MLNQRTIDIHDFPFTEVIVNAGTTLVLFDCFIPDLDLVVWKMRPCSSDVVTDKFLSVAVELFDSAIEHEMPKLPAGKNRRPRGDRAAYWSNLY